MQTLRLLSQSFVDLRAKAFKIATDPVGLRVGRVVTARLGG